MLDITTRCHSCAMPFEIECDNEPETFEQYGRPYFKLDGSECWTDCPNCSRKHTAGYAMELLETDQPMPDRRKPGPFASLRDLRSTTCPCGCGSVEICDDHRARVKEHDDAIPF